MMDKVVREAKASVQSLARGLAILEFIANSVNPLRLKDVVSAFDIDQASAYRFLSTLEACGYLNRDESNKTYSLADKLSGAGFFKTSGEMLIERVRPYLVRMCAETGQTAHLALLEGSEVKLVAIEEAKGVVSIRQSIGDGDPLYCSAVGKAILAFLPENQSESLINGLSFERFTDKTILSPEQLKVELDETRKDGVAYDDCEGNELVCCIAVPVLDGEGKPLASIGISMVRPTLSGGPREQHSLIGKVKEIAEQFVEDHL